MNLLLFLSALLSALTGVGGQARAPQVTTSVSVAAERAVENIAEVAASRPVIALPPLISAAAAPIAMALTCVAREPLFAGRRRE